MTQRGWYLGYSTVQYSTVQYSTVQYSAIPVIHSKYVLFLKVKGIWQGIPPAVQTEEPEQETFHDSWHPEGSYLWSEENSVTVTTHS